MRLMCDVVQSDLVIVGFLCERPESSLRPLSSAQAAAPRKDTIFR